MLTMSQLESLSQLPPPLLTAYVRTVSGEASLHGATPGYLAWLKDESRPVTESLSPTEQELFRKQLDRVEEFLRQRQSGLYHRNMYSNTEITGQLKAHPPMTRR